MMLLLLFADKKYLSTILFLFAYNMSAILGMTHHVNDTPLSSFLPPSAFNIDYLSLDDNVVDDDMAR